MELLKDRNTEWKGLPWRIAVCKAESCNHSSSNQQDYKKLGKWVLKGQKLIKKISKISVLGTRIR